MKGSEKAGGTGGLRVLMMPDYRRRNPYQSLIADHMPRDVAEVYFARGYRRALPIYREARGSRPDVLHLHWFDPYVLGSALPARLWFANRLLTDLRMTLRMGVPVVWTIHNLVPHEAKHRGLEIWLNRKVAELSSGAIVHSHAALSAVDELYRLNPGRTHVIPHGHYRSCYPPMPQPDAARKALGLEDPAARPMFLFFGQLRPYKGVERLLDAWELLAQSSSGVPGTLAIVGRALDAAFSAKLQARSEALPNVVFREGFVPDEEVPTWFAAADFAVLPFERILTSGSLLLAMSFDCPIIAPDVEMVHECLGPAAQLLFESGSTHGLAAVMQRAASGDSEGLRSEVRSACDRLDWSGISARTAGIYRNAAATRRHA